jgi:hypothetical protein
MFQGYIYVGERLFPGLIPSSNDFFNKIGQQLFTNEVSRDLQDIWYAFYMSCSAAIAT